MSPQHLAIDRCREFFGRRLRELAWAAGFALVLGMSQAQAISLGQIRVDSHLGQPLDAVVHVTAAPGEVLTASCFSTAPADASVLPGLANIRLSLSRKVTPMALRLTTREPVREPLSEVVLQVRCPGVPSITRTFWVMVNPQGIADNRSVTTAPVVERALDRGVSADRPTAAASRPRGAVRATTGTERVRVYSAYAGPTDPISPGETYIVRNGDVLSMIASRVSGRASNTVWELADKIFRLNPAAFISGDPDMLIAGSQIYVPLPAVPMPLSPSPARSAAPAIVSGDVAAPPPLSSQPPVATAATGAPAVPLPAMVLSRSLSPLSVSRIQQRRSGVVNLPAVTGSQRDPQTATSAITTIAAAGNEQNVPETPAEQSSPDVAVTPPKLAVAPAPASQQAGGMGWAAFIGLLLLVLVGVPLAMLMYRRSVTRRYRDDLRKALRRRRYADELVRARQQHEPADSGYSVTESAAEPEPFDTAPDVLQAESFSEASPETEPDSPASGIELPAAGPSAMLANLLDTDRTVQVPSPEESLDLEFPEMSDDVAIPVAPDERDLTLEIETPNGEPSLDLELPDTLTTAALTDEQDAESTGTTDGFDDMEELDFDPELLALDYSKEYEAAHQAAGTDESGDLSVDSTHDASTREARLDSGETSEYYHLEAQVDTRVDELSFDDDDDEGNDDDDDDAAKVVQFPQQQSGK